MENTVSKIVDGIGRQAMSDRLGVGLTAISNAVVARRFPAAWYAVVLDMCRKEGLDCPMDAFNWKPAEALE